MILKYAFLYNLHISFYKISGYIEDHDGNKYLTEVHIDARNKNVLEKFEEMFDGINYLIKFKKKSIVIITVIIT